MVKTDKEVNKAVEKKLSNYRKNYRIEKNYRIKKCQRL